MPKLTFESGTLHYLMFALRFYLTTTIYTVHRVLFPLSIRKHNHIMLLMCNLTFLKLFKEQVLHLEKYLMVSSFKTDLLS